MTTWNLCQQAASWLDKQKPGWFKEIDLEQLDMKEDCLCVMGQLVGSWIKWKVNTSSIIYKSRYDAAFSSPIRFDYNSRQEHFENLEKYWRTLIKQRLDKYASN